MGKWIYPIGVVSDVLALHPETIRVWERAGLIAPSRRNGHRLYSDQDLTRVRFIKRLLDKGLNLAGVRALIELYPCWTMENCPECMRTTDRQDCAKPCWKEENTYCRSCFLDPALCLSCEHAEKQAASAPSPQ